MRRVRLTYLFWGFIWVSAAGCATIRPVTSYDAAFNFSSYHTFAWMPDAQMLYIPPEVSPALVRHIQSTVTDALTRKGFRLIADPASADFVIDFSIGTREKIRENYPAAGEQTHVSIWGRRYYGDIDIRDFTKGSLAIDVFDVRSRQGVWHGHAKKNILLGSEAQSIAEADKVIKAILAEFPPEESSTGTAAQTRPNVPPAR